MKASRPQNPTNFSRGSMSVTVVILSDVVIGWKIAMFVLTAYIALGAFS